jgi:hypothetical protein
MVDLYEDILRSLTSRKKTPLEKYNMLLEKINKREIEFKKELMSSSNKLQLATADLNISKYSFTIDKTIKSFTAEVDLQYEDVVLKPFEIPEYKYKITHNTEVVYNYNAPTIPYFLKLLWVEGSMTISSNKCYNFVPTINNINIVNNERNEIIRTNTSQMVLLPTNTYMIKDQKYEQIKSNKFINEYQIALAKYFKKLKVFKKKKEYHVEELYYQIKNTIQYENMLNNIKKEYNSLAKAIPSMRQNKEYLKDELKEMQRRKTQVSNQIKFNTNRAKGILENAKNKASNIKEKAYQHYYDRGMRRKYAKNKKKCMNAFEAKMLKQALEGNKISVPK